MMKKVWLIIAVTAVLIMLTGVCCAEEAEHFSSGGRFRAAAPVSQQHKPAAAEESSLPPALRSIGAEAFEGTSLGGVILPETVEEIKDRAFADMAFLLRIYIPEAAKELGSDLFGSNDTVLITAPANSAGVAWAREHHHLLAVLQMLKAWSEKEDIPGILPGIDIKTAEATENGESCLAEKQAPRPGRLTGELKASQYKGIASQYIQSRYFP